jgi:hypothetical protein
MGRRRWINGGIACLLLWFLPISAYCEKASIQEVSVKGATGAWKVSLQVKDCFTEKMEEAIQTGIRTVFTFYLQVHQKRGWWWKDRKVASAQFHHAIQYDPILGEYQVSLEEKNTHLVTRNFAEAKAWMAGVEEVEIRSSSPLKPGVSTELRIKAQLDPVKLPLHLENLFFFVSLWDFETDWYVKPLLP